jgi:hypothetical protein
MKIDFYNTTQDDFYNIIQDNLDDNFRLRLLYDITALYCPSIGGNKLSKPLHRELINTFDFIRLEISFNRLFDVSF